jgi:hypothetical protein
MMGSDSFWLGYVCGVIASIFFVTMIKHTEDYACQTKNNVADCVWVSVPFEIETD